MYLFDYIMCKCHIFIKKKYIVKESFTYRVAYIYIFFSFIIFIKFMNTHLEIKSHTL